MTVPRYTQIDHALTRSCCVQLNIRASADVVWALLTNAAAYPSWNPTVCRIDGRIEAGQRIRLHVPGSSRTFSPRVSELAAGRRMIWSGGLAPLFKGVRTFVLMPESDGTTSFAMEERFSGVVFALVKSRMPDFRPIFEAFAAGLQREAERVAGWTAI